MALPYARAQLMRYLTDKVIENVAKQVSKPALTPAQQEAALATAAPDVAQVVNALNQAMIQIQTELNSLDSRIARVDRRMTRLEKRWGWIAMFRVVLAIVLAFIFGLVLYQLLVWGHWIKVNNAG